MKFGVLFDKVLHRYRRDTQWRRALLIAGPRLCVVLTLPSLLRPPRFSFYLFFSPAFHHDYSQPLVSSTHLSTLPTFLFWACFYFFPKTFLNNKRDYYLLYMTLPLLSIKLNFMCSFMLEHSLIHPEQLTALVGFTQLTFPHNFWSCAPLGWKEKCFCMLQDFFLFFKTAYIHSF